LRLIEKKSLLREATNVIASRQINIAVIIILVYFFEELIEQLSFVRTKDSNNDTWYFKS
jgi:hypothetical protein